MRLLRWTSAYFSKFGIDTPRVDAEVLLAHCLGINRIDLYLRHDQPLEKDELFRFKQVIRRRVRREPVAYITGRREFWSIDLKVSSQVLIPRPETELLVEHAQEMMAGRQAVRVLELGTGSGAICLALATLNPDWWIVGSDISFKAVALARSNAMDHDLANRVAFMVADWTAAIDPIGPGFDLVISNPPYIKSADLEELEPEIRLFEPRIALDGGQNGLECIEQIVKKAESHLKADGFLMLEIGHDQQQEVESLLRDRSAYHQVYSLKDYGGHWRVVVGRRKSG